MKVSKNGNTFNVNGVQLRAFLNSGYELVKEEPKATELKSKEPKATKK